MGGQRKEEADTESTRFTRRELKTVMRARAGKDDTWWQRFTADANPYRQTDAQARIQANSTATKVTADRKFTVTAPGADGRYNAEARPYLDGARITFTPAMHGHIRIKHGAIPLGDVHGARRLVKGLPDNGVVDVNSSGVITVTFLPEPKARNYRKR